MGKLDDIIRRNKHPKRFGEKMTVGIGLSVFVLIILLLMVCTDLGRRPDDPGPSRPSTIDPTDRRVDDVRLGTPRAGSQGQGVRP